MSWYRSRNGLQSEVSANVLPYSMTLAAVRILYGKRRKRFFRQSSSPFGPATAVAAAS